MRCNREAMVVADNALAIIVARMGGGVRIIDNKPGWANSLQIRSESSSALYTVAQRKTDGTWGCSCRGWISHRRCKHLSAMLPALKALS